MYGKHVKGIVFPIEQRAKTECPPLILRQVGTRPFPYPLVPFDKIAFS